MGPWRAACGGEGGAVIARIRRWLDSWFAVEVDDVVIVPIEKWHLIIDERNNLRAEVERLRRLVREGV